MQNHAGYTHILCLQSSTLPQFACDKGCIFDASLVPEVGQGMGNLYCHPLEAEHRA